MANFRAIHAVGESLRSYLRNIYPADLPTFDIQLISSTKLAETEELSNALTLLLHRVTINEHLRNSQLGNGNELSARKTPLALDLHYLMTVWADNAADEQIVLAWAMQQLHQYSCFDASSLSPEAGWGMGETIEVVLVDLSSEEIMRIWDRLKPSYHLSVAYVARAVRIDSVHQNDVLPVVATRFAWQEQEER